LGYFLILVNIRQKGEVQKMLSLSSMQNVFRMFGNIKGPLFYSYHIFHERLYCRDF